MHLNKLIEAFLWIQLLSYAILNAYIYHIIDIGPLHKNILAFIYTSYTDAHAAMCFTPWPPEKGYLATKQYFV